MEEYENNAYFWQKLDTFYLSSQFEVIRKKGDHHPDFPNLVYPVTYGYLNDTNGQKDGVSVYKGSGSLYTITGLIVAVDILKKTLDVKMLIGCNQEETEEVLRFLNQTDYQKTVLIKKGSKIPTWGVSDN